MRRFHSVLSCLAFLLLVDRAWSQDEPRQAQLFDGTVLTGTLERLTLQNAVFRSGNQSRTVPLEELQLWGRPAEVRSGSYVLMADGGIIAGEVIAISGEQVEVRSTRRPGLWQASRVPRASVQAIVYEKSTSPFERDRLDFRLTSAEPEDRLLLVGGDSLTGALWETSVPDEAATDAELAFRFLPQGARQPLVIPQSRVAAVTFRQKRDATSRLPEDVAGRCWIGMADGSLVLSESIEQKDNVISVTLAKGGTLFANAADADVEPPESFWSRVEFLQPQSSRVVFVSDLETIGFKHVPLFDWTIDYANDRSIAGSRLRCAGHKWLKGVSMPATSRLAYDVPAGSKRFEAEIAIDDAAASHGSVVFRVYLESAEGNWKPAFESKMLRGGDPPAAVRIEVGEAKRLALVVDMADRGDLCDWANWLNARFIK